MSKGECVLAKNAPHTPQRLRTKDCVRPIIRRSARSSGKIPVTPPRNGHERTIFHRIINQRPHDRRLDGLGHRGLGSKLFTYAPFFCLLPGVYCGFHFRNGRHHCGPRDKANLLGTAATSQRDLQDGFCTCVISRILLRGILF